MSFARLVIVGALASAMSIGAAQGAGRSKGDGMTAAQKASAARATKGKVAGCKRAANRQQLSFEARSAFMTGCLSR